MLGDANEVLNERAVVVMARMSHKLTGRDFSTSAVPSNPTADHNNLLGGDSHEVEHGLSVKVQVQKLIDQATSHENICQNYVGWCPFWSIWSFVIVYNRALETCCCRLSSR
ncbi:serine/threonine-protein kinase TOR-like [Brassica rapa]|uniref:serine/threonine-protein kinase TOR-like n=1 Tax=Brassica campestris TaxID=3711 RepID=UPI00142E089B|nr:serine/threonine-protein kinase TOR-like [Brassica rapa]